MADLVLGPLVRHVGETEANVWVETDAACEVEILDHRQRTFAVAGRHYALVSIEGLDPGRRYEYEVALDGERAWPPADSELPPSVIKTVDPEGDVDVAFGSCRVALPHTEPYTLSKDEHPEGREFDALYVMANEMLAREREQWPELLVLLGDQVYVDEGSPRVREFIRSRRGTGTEPGEEVLDFEEYVALYHESWGEPLIRWLFSTLPTAMVWDDHDMADDWNISRAWVEEIEARPWWRQRVIGGFCSYWIYQHIGNLSPRELRENDLYQEVSAAEDATEILHRWVDDVGTTGEGYRWSFCRDIGRIRLIVMDSRAGRVLDGDHRSIFNEEVWEWLGAQTEGDFDHLLLGTSDPFLLAPGMHYVESWNEMVCDGAWGAAAAKAGERLRRALDFDHWAAFRKSFDRVSGLIEEIASGKRGKAPATIVLLSGDVHHAYLAEVGFRRGAGVRSAVYQAVCSPFRNPLDAHERRYLRLACKRPFEVLARGLARGAGAPDPRIRWRLVEGPYFDNQIGILRLEGRRASVRLNKTVAGEHEERELDCVFEYPLTDPAPKSPDRG